MIDHRHILAILLVAVKLWAPLYGHVYFLEPAHAESSSTAAVCVQDRGVSDQESQENRQHIISCHELEQPGLLASDVSVHFSPAISTLASSDLDATLPGYRSPIRIPPKHLA